MVPLGVSLVFGAWNLSARYAVVVAILGALGLGSLSVKPTKPQMNESLVLIALVFLLTSLLMTIPMTGAGLSFVDAFFEAVSGATTTGLSTLDNVEAHAGHLPVRPGLDAMVRRPGHRYSVGGPDISAREGSANVWPITSLKETTWPRYKNSCEARRPDIFRHHRGRNFNPHRLQRFYPGCNPLHHGLHHGRRVHRRV
jgi:hypothetical protein